MRGWARATPILLEGPTPPSFAIVSHAQASTYFVTSLLDSCQGIRNARPTQVSIYFTIGGKCVARVNDFIRIGQDNQ